MNPPSPKTAVLSLAPRSPGGAPGYSDALIDGLPSGIIVIDREFRIQRVNRYVATWIGRAAEEMAGQHCYHLMHARESPCPDCPCAVSFRTGEPATVVHDGIDRHGGATHAEIISMPIHDPSGQVVLALESVRDISERERHLRQLAEAVDRLETSQAELERRNEELQLLSGLLGATSCTMGLDALLEVLLAGALRLVGPGTGGALLLLDGTGRRLRLAASRGSEGDFKPCDDYVQLGECLCGSAALSGDAVAASIAPNTSRVVESYRRGDASVAIPLSASAGVLGVLAIHFPPGKRLPPGRERLYELMGRQMGIAIENARLFEQTDAQLHRKLAELTRALAAVEQERARAQASERAKEELVTMLSHDLRSPLSVILQDANEFGRTCGDESCKASRASTRHAVRRAAAMLNDVVDSARLESGALDLRHEPMDLVQVLQDLVGDGFPASERGRLKLATDLKAAPVRGDRSWLERATANVIGNALKFGPPGTPVVVRLWGDGSAVRIEVADRGPGIPAAELPLIFKRFFRASNAQRTGGSGLGLYIARLVVEAHGGQVAVRSELGHGATVTLALPVVPAASA
jgi:PAS domain S-box-containing protein